MDGGEGGDKVCAKNMGHGSDDNGGGDGGEDGGGDCAACGDGAGGGGDGSGNSGGGCEAGGNDDCSVDGSKDAKAGGGPGKLSGV